MRMGTTSDPPSPEPSLASGGVDIDAMGVAVLVSFVSGAAGEGNRSSREAGKRHDVITQCCIHVLCVGVPLYLGRAKQRHSILQRVLRGG